MRFENHAAFISISNIIPSGVFLYFIMNKLKKTYSIVGQ